MNKPKSESPSSIEVHLAGLYGRINYERQDRVTPRHFKLRNMREILRRLGNPHLKYPVVHVAGTKGKGSVSTMIGQILTASGRRTGVYTSPHLETIHQRMVVGGALITDQQLVDTLTALDPVVRSMDEEADQLNYRHLTFFEITTAAAFHFFAIQNCDAVVLEVGLGGRLDSTNVCQPVTSVITNISVDHTRQLGATVDKIAFEKAGIIKPRVPVVSGATNAEAAEVIAQVAADNQSSLMVLGQDFDFEEDGADCSLMFSSSGEVDLHGGNELLDAPCLELCDSDQSTDDQPIHRFSYQIEDLKLSLIGQHQRANAAVAVAAIQMLNARGWNVSDEQIRTGLKRATLAGRTEVASRAPAIVIDMAHNVASIDALVTALKCDFPQWKTASKRTLMLATSRDKDAIGMLRPLVENFDQLILTRYQDNPRGKPVDELLAIATEIQSELRSESRPAAELLTEPNPELAWEGIWNDLGQNDLVCITGSAFLVAELRKTVMVAVESRKPWKDIFRTCD